MPRFRVSIPAEVLIDIEAPDVHAALRKADEVQADNIEEAVSEDVLVTVVVRDDDSDEVEEFHGCRLWIIEGRRPFIHPVEG